MQKQLLFLKHDERFHVNCFSIMSIALINSLWNNRKKQNHSGDPDFYRVAKIYHAHLSDIFILDSVR